MEGRATELVPGAAKGGTLAWLDELPEGWEVRPLKFAARINPETLADDTDGAFEFHYVDITGVSSDGRIAIDDPIRFENAPSRARRVVRLSDTILATVRTYLKAIAFIGEDLAGNVASTGFAVLRPRPDVVPEYLWRFVQSEPFVNAVVAHSTGVSYPAINPSTLGGLPIFLPPRNTQQTIADFLDRETAKIDALIDKKQRLLELLEEKRTALITHAVTKGLDPDVEMKDSEVEWLGQIPEHWEVIILSRVLQRITYGFTNPMPTSEQGPYMLTANDIGDGVIRYETARRTQEDAYREKLTAKSRPRVGDVLLTKDGSLGRVAVADDKAACINQSVALLRTRESVQAEFLAYLLRGAAYQDRMVFEAGGTTIKHIYITRLAKMPIGLPPIEEQSAISAVLDTAEQAVEHTSELVRDAIELMHEYRTALISAAVTGKIDVREALA